MTTIMLAAAACLAAAQGQPAPSGALVRNVNVVDVAAGRVLPGQDVEISGDRIARITPHAAQMAGPLRAGTFLVDGTDLYLMPGLFDAHVHMVASPDSFAPLLVANGVTCVRDTGAPTEAILDLRARAAAGALIPQIVCTGAIVDGDPPVWPFSEPCDTPEEARAAVNRLAAAGVDMIKVYSLLKKDVYLAAIDEAHRLGLKATGHIPLNVTIEEAMAAGQDGCEHLTGFEHAVAALSGWKPPEGARSPWIWFAAWPTLPDAPPDEVTRFAQRLRASGMYQCPTLVVMEGVGSLTDPDDAANDPLMAYVPAVLRSFWSGGGYAAMAPHSHAALPHMQAMVAALNRAGVPIMVGTDLANPHVYAGFSVHREMALLQAAGMPPADVLRAATLAPATFCGLDTSLGSIRKDMVASLVLVRADPLADVANASQIEAVFLRGRHFDRAALDAMLEEVKSSVAASLPAAQPVALDLPGEVLRRGRYVFRFQQFDGGFEEFVITRDQAGWHMKADMQPRGGPQPPAVLTFRATPEFDFLGAEYEMQTAQPVAASYSIAGGTLTARARSAGADLPVQELALPEGAVMSSPASVTDFALLGAAKLAPGESRTFPLVTFGFEGWRAGIVEYTLTRLEDTRLTIDGAEVAARAYASEMVLPFGKVTGQAWTDDRGVMVKSVMVMPFGTVTVRLDGLAE
jgi:imidazolonepropionase-like amidohydrolase